MLLLRSHVTHSKDVKIFAARPWFVSTSHAIILKMKSYTSGVVISSVLPGSSEVLPLMAGAVRLTSFFNSHNNPQNILLESLPGEPEEISASQQSDWFKSLALTYVNTRKRGYVFQNLIPLQDEYLG